MPTVLRIGPWRFHFYSDEGTEPVHIHVTDGSSTAKIWVNPVRLQHNKGFGNKDINKIVKAVLENEDLIREAWNDYFAD